MEQSLDEIARLTFEASAGARTAPTTREVMGMISVIAAAVRNLEGVVFPIAGARVTLGHVEGSRGAFAEQLDQGRIRRLEAALADERKRHGVTEAALEKFTSACADQTIQIMELRGELMREREVPALDAHRITELEAKCKRLEATIENHRRAASPNDATIERMDRAERAVSRLQGHIAETEAMIKKWDAQIEAVTGPAREGETYADAAVRAIKELTRLNQEQQARLGDERVLLRERDAQIDRLRNRMPNGHDMMLDVLITETIEEAEAPCPDCKSMAEALEQANENTRAADSDRVPLRMDLDVAQAKLAKAEALIARVNEWRKPQGPAAVHTTPVRQMIEAIDEYNKPEPDDIDF